MEFCCSGQRNYTKAVRQNAEAVKSKHHENSGADRQVNTSVSQETIHNSFDQSWSVDNCCFDWGAIGNSERVLVFGGSGEAIFSDSSFFMVYNRQYSDSPGDYSTRSLMQYRNADGAKSAEYSSSVWGAFWLFLPVRRHVKGDRFVSSLRYSTIAASFSGPLGRQMLDSAARNGSVLNLFADNQGPAGHFYRSLSCQSQISCWTFLGSRLRFPVESTKASIRNRG